MRHILIILISILLLSSPLFGQETGILFFSFENGEFVYSEEGEDDNDGKYVGEFKDGKPNGQGTLTLSDGRKYVGKYKDASPWNGKIYDQIGNIIGKYVNGKQIKQ